jgi:hypothetical protein
MPGCECVGTRSAGLVLAKQPTKSPVLPCRNTGTPIRLPRAGRLDRSRHQQPYPRRPPDQALTVADISTLQLNGGLAYLSPATPPSPGRNSPMNSSTSPAHSTSRTTTTSSVPYGQSTTPLPVTSPARSTPSSPGTAVLRPISGGRSTPCTKPSGGYATTIRLHRPHGRHKPIPESEPCPLVQSGTEARCPGYSATGPIAAAHGGSVNGRLIGLDQNLSSAAGAMKT